VRVNDRVATPNPAWSSDQPDPATSSAPYRFYNIGNHSPVQLMDYIACIEKALCKTAKKNMLPMQPGDVPATFADISDLKADIGFEPKTPIEVGVGRFVAWYRDYYRC
jgi:UDP-glucuronate 4-epimerase